MTRSAIYRCRECGYEGEQFFDYTPPPVVTQPHGDEHTVCDATMDRVWTPIAIGRVVGGGGSPAR